MGERKRLLLCWGINLAAAAAIAVWPMLFSIAGNEMGYCIVNYYVLYPLCTLILGAVQGSASHWCRFLYPAAAGIVFSALPWITFHTWEGFSVVFGAAPAVCGTLLGCWLRYRKRKRREAGN